MKYTLRSSVETRSSLLIHELAARVGLPSHTIRYYEKEGLLDRAHSQRLANGYRRYAESAIERLMLIRKGQAAGFTLGEIRDLIDVWEAGKLSREDKLAIIDSKIDALSRRIADLEGMRASLIEKRAIIAEETELSTQTLTGTLDGIPTHRTS